MFATPLFNGYDSDPYYFHHQPAYRRQQQKPSSSYNQQQQRGRRRYLQQLQASEQEAQRRQAARQEYLQRLKEEEMYRRAYEVARRRREMEEAEQVREYLFGTDDHEFGGNVGEEEEEAMEPVFRVMQGADGLLYKVKVGEKLRPRPQRSSRRNSSTARMASPQHGGDGYHQQFVRGPDGRTYRVQRQPNKEEMKQKAAWFSRANHTTSDQTTDEESSSEFGAEDAPLQPTPPSSFASSSRVRIPIRPPFMTRKRSNDNRNSKKVTVVVEDASDSESEEDEYPSASSPWRNRFVPSPGQSWMEPVKSA